ncbi:hypothetical protein CYMTET_56293 [Cymbomonas tetramitiformis]|uniref:EamA domain-containing protein n=1 Tax=Cymbomonas tetramitiformis TaxID=36881 RepID=A0AAE0BCG1_9CHLO|nr:hypothetical protein CYMTET_56293 [Cymbomonas tetramitiformis]
MSEGKADRGALLAGAELGLWGFASTLAQAWGLKNTTAVHAAVLLSLINVLVPLLSSRTGEAISQRTWTGCSIAVVATIVLGTDLGTAGGVMGELSPGDAGVLTAAVLYAWITVRLGTLAKKYPGDLLTIWRSGFKLIFASSLVALEVANLSAFPSGEMARSSISMQSLWEGWRDPFQWAIILYSAVAPEALASLLQARGQAELPPSQAQVIYASTAMWTSAWAVLLVGEDIAPNELVGGGLMIVAVLLSSISDSDKQEDVSQK